MPLSLTITPSVVNAINAREASRAFLGSMLQTLGYPKKPGESLTPADINELINSPYASIVKNSLAVEIATQIQSQDIINNIIQNNLENNWMDEHITNLLRLAANAKESKSELDLIPPTQSALQPAAKTDIAELYKKREELVEENIRLSNDLKLAQDNLEVTKTEIIDTSEQNAQKLKDIINDYNEVHPQANPIKLNPRQIEYLPDFLRDYQKADSDALKQQLLNQFKNRGEKVFSGEGYQFGAFEDLLKQLTEKSNPALEKLLDKIFLDRQKTEKALDKSVDNFFTTQAKYDDNREKINKIDKQVEKEFQGEHKQEASSSWQTWIQQGYKNNQKKKHPNADDEETSEQNETLKQGAKLAVRMYMGG